MALSRVGAAVGLEGDLGGFTIHAASGPQLPSLPAGPSTGRVIAPRTKKELEMVVLEFSMFPLDKGVSLSPYVAKSLEVIESSGLPYECHAMGTLIEGEIDEVLAVVRQCFDTMAAHADRIECTIKMDYRRGRTEGLKTKVASVEAQLGHKLNK
jgi:uncharacterized protein (TIGR00106 family)